MARFLCGCDRRRSFVPDHIARNRACRPAPMKIRKVAYFIALCEELSFTRAAKRCGIAQPSLTRAIQLLEKEVGGRLFERGSSSIRLTELGTLLLADFVAISQAAEKITRKAANLVATNPSASGRGPAEAYIRALTIGASADHIDDLDCVSRS